MLGCGKAAANMAEVAAQVLEGDVSGCVVTRYGHTPNRPAGVPSRITRRATYVFREESDGKWRCVVDNSYGTDLLGVA